MNYEIIATLGPSSEREEIWNAMLEEGVTAFRLNTSHLSLEQLHGWLDRLIPFLKSASSVPLVLDLQGSKWRLGQFAAADLSAGEMIELALAESADGSQVLPVPHADFFKAATSSNGEIVLNDAKVRLAIESSSADGLQARVTQAGPVSSRKGITFAESDFRTEAMSEKDRLIVEQTCRQPNLQYAVSYVKDAAEMARYRALIDGIAGCTVQLIAKLERRLAMEEAQQIASYANSLWVCRGDLGAELGLKAMAEAVHRLSGQVSVFPVPVIIAGQVLEHMTAHAAPTRSEVCYLFDALQAGYQGVVLSDETAVGQDPIESCRAAAIFKLPFK